MYYLTSVYATRSIFAVALDAACLLSAFWLTWLLEKPDFSGTFFALAAIACAFGAAALLFFNNAYRPETLGSGPRTSVAILTTMGMGLAVALATYFFVPLPAGVTPLLAWISTLYFSMLLVARVGLRLVLGTRWLTTNVLVIGASDLGMSIAELLENRGDTGIRMIGFLSDDMALHQHGGRFGIFPVIGRADELEKVLLDRKVDCIVVASKDRRESFPMDALMHAKTRGVKVESGVSFLERLSGRVYMRDLRSSYLIFGGGFKTSLSYRIVRRTIDVVGAGVLLVLCAPFLALTALAIKLESPGPVIFRQERLGRDDKPFMMNKLRSMKHNAESKSGAVFTAQNDDRITNVGEIIRRTRLDELPQLWNVLRGDMSLVGPRAERPEFADLLHEIYPYYSYRTIVRPGLTGWAQTRFGYVNSVEAYEEKLALDLYYLKYRNLVLDFIILAQTVKTVLYFRGM